MFTDFQGHQKGHKSFVLLGFTAFFGLTWTVKKVYNGGGGGNRTPVREHSTRSIYRFSSGIDFTTLLAPEQAQRSNLAGNLLAENPGELRSPPA